MAEHGELDTELVECDPPRAVAVARSKDARGNRNVVNHSALLQNAHELRRRQPRLAIRRMLHRSHQLLQRRPAKRSRALQLRQKHLAVHSTTATTAAPPRRRGALALCFVEKELHAGFTEQHAFAFAIAGPMLQRTVGERASAERTYGAHGRT